MKITDRIIGKGSFLCHNKYLAKKLGIEESFLFSCMIEGSAMLADKDGWFYQTIETLYKITGIKRGKQDRIIEKLISFGLVEKRLDGKPEKRYFRIDEEKTIELIEKTHIEETGVNTKRLDVAEIAEPEAIEKEIQQTPKISTELTVPNEITTIIEEKNINIEPNNVDNQAQNQTFQILKKEQKQIELETKIKLDDQVLLAIAVNINSIVDHYCEIYNKRVKSSTSFAKNYCIWCQVYNDDEIKKAISNIKYDKFWKDKMDLTILFRRKNPRGEAVDYIQHLLNVDTTEAKRYGAGMIAFI